MRKDGTCPANLATDKLTSSWSGPRFAAMPTDSWDQRASARISTPGDILKLLIASTTTGQRSNSLDALRTRAGSATLPCRPGGRRIISLSWLSATSPAFLAYRHPPLFGKTPELSSSPAAGRNIRKSAGVIRREPSSPVPSPWLQTGSALSGRQHQAFQAAQPGHLGY